MKELLIIGAIAAVTVGVLYRKEPPLSKAVRNGASGIQHAADDYRNSAIGIANSIKNGGKAIGSIANTTAQIIDSFRTFTSSASNADSSYGSVNTSAPVLSGTDPYVAAYGPGNSIAGDVIVETPANAISPQWYDPNTTNA